MHTNPYEYQTCYRIFTLSQLVMCLVVTFALLKSMCNSVNQLVTASSLTDTLKELQERMRALHEDINRLKTNAPPPRKSPIVMMRNSDQNTTQRIPGMSWAEEMDILDSIPDNQPSDKACIMQVLPCTGVCITVSFHFMANSARRAL